MAMLRLFQTLHCCNKYQFFFILGIPSFLAAAAYGGDFSQCLLCIVISSSINLLNVYQQHKDCIIFDVPRFISLLNISCTNISTIGEHTASNIQYLGIPGMTSPGVQPNIFRFMVVLITMITIIMLGNKATVTLLQCSHTATLFMEPTRY